MGSLLGEKRGLGWGAGRKDPIALQNHCRLTCIPGHADEIKGSDKLHLSSSVDWLCLYLLINSLQVSTRVKSLLQLVSNTAFTPKDLKNVVSFLKT